MKKLILLFAVFTAVGCTGIKTTTAGLENEAFLVFLGNPKDYETGVEVNIDEKTSFSAEVQKNHTARPNGKSLRYFNRTSCGLGCSQRRNDLSKKNFCIHTRD